MVSRTMMTMLLGISPDDPEIGAYIQSADDIVNSIFSLPVNLPGFAFRKVSKTRKNDVASMHWWVCLVPHLSQKPIAF